MTQVTIFHTRLLGQLKEKYEFFIDIKFWNKIHNDLYIFTII